LPSNSFKMMVLMRSTYGLLHTLQVVGLQVGNQLSFYPRNNCGAFEGEGGVELHQGGSCSDLIICIFATCNPSHSYKRNATACQSIHFAQQLGGHLLERSSTQS